MANPKNCWYCTHFAKGLQGTNQGECRRNAPSGLDTSIINDLGDRSVPFAEIYDGTTEWCGDFQAALTDPGDPPL